MVPAEDYDLWTRALLKGLKLANLPEVLYEYRTHPQQATSQTEKILAKTREVQVSYIRAALPSLSQNSIEAFPKRLWAVFLANMKSKFFDWKLLAKRLYKVSKVQRVD